MAEQAVAFTTRLEPQDEYTHTPDKALKPSNWTLTSRATNSKLPEAINAPNTN